MQMFMLKILCKGALTYIIVVLILLKKLLIHVIIILQNIYVST